MSKENSAGETIGATTTIILEPARISGSTVEPSRREIARKRRKERRLSWALVLGMLVFAVFWLLGMQLVSWLAVGFLACGWGAFDVEACTGGVFACFCGRVHGPLFGICVSSRKEELVGCRVG